MQRTILAAGTIAMTIAAQAQLAPTTEAPLYQHLLEVNKEWSVMYPDLPEGGRLVRFNSEAERIAAHLHRVAAHQRAHTPEGLAAPALAERLSLLSALDTYADRGIFPRNHVLPVRNPVFIDPHGTACAVGQLMIVSGNDGLAKRIQDEMNLAYVHDMERADVFAWAGEHGFTEDELAWIQPGYPPSIPWYALGNGTNGTVAELLRLSNGELIVAGSFTAAGGTSVSNVARWNGTAYEALGSGVQGEITCAIEYAGSIWLGGTFNSGTADLAEWNGSTWEFSAAFASKIPYVSALHEHNDLLHAAGGTTGFAGTSYSVKRLVGSEWEAVGQELDGTIRDLDTFGGTLVCGGEFTADWSGPDTANAQHVARLEGGTWVQLAEGLNGNVRDLLVHDGQLYASGDAIGEVATYFGLARIGTGGSAWELLMPNVADYLYSPLDGIVGINAMMPDPSGASIHLGGDFYAGVGLTYGMGLATWHGEPDDVSVLGEFQGGVNDLELLGASTLVAGGASEFLQNLATTDLTLGLEPLAGSSAISVWPNPVVDVLRIDATAAVMNVELLDATGRLVRRINNVRAGDTIDVHELGTGTYSARILSGNKVLSATFIKR